MKMKRMKKNRTTTTKKRMTMRTSWAVIMSTQDFETPVCGNSSNSSHQELLGET